MIFVRVLDVATYKDEIFILEEDRSLIRVAYNPEQECSKFYYYYYFNIIFRPFLKHG